MIPIALTIAGSDPSGGAGIQADLKTFHQLGVYGTAAITLITVQNTTRVSRVETLDPALVAEQITAVLEDLPPQAAKTGAMGTAAIIEAVGQRGMTLRRNVPLVVDPVMISKHGAPLMDADARTALRDLLIPNAALVTPNLPEAAELAECRVRTSDQMKEAAMRIAQLGARAVLSRAAIWKARISKTRRSTFSTTTAFSPNSAPRGSTPAIPTGRDALIRRPSRRFWRAGPRFRMRSRAPNGSSTRRSEPIPAWARARAR